jgi:hypothetical protein
MGKSHPATSLSDMPIFAAIPLEMALRSRLAEPLPNIQCSSLRLLGLDGETLSSLYRMVMI